MHFLSHKINFQTKFDVFSQVILGSQEDIQNKNYLQNFFIYTNLTKLKNLKVEGNIAGQVICHKNMLQTR